MRPKDDLGRPLPIPHLRMEEAPMLRQAVVIAISADARNCFLNTKRKAQIADKAIDHVVDGDEMPAFIKGERMVSIWRVAVEAVREALPAV